MARVDYGPARSQRPGPEDEHALLSADRQAPLGPDASYRQSEAGRPNGAEISTGELTTPGIVMAARWHLVGSTATLDPGNAVRCRCRRICCRMQHDLGWQGANHKGSAATNRGRGVLLAGNCDTITGFVEFCPIRGGEARSESWPCAGRKDQ